MSSSSSSSSSLESKEAKTDFVPYTPSKKVAAEQQPRVIVNNEWCDNMIGIISKQSACMTAVFSDSSSAMASGKHPVSFVGQNQYKKAILSQSPEQGTTQPYGLFTSPPLRIYGERTTLARDVMTKLFLENATLTKDQMIEEKKTPGKHYVPRIGVEGSPLQQEAFERFVIHLCIVCLYLYGGSTEADKQTVEKCEIEPEEWNTKFDNFKSLTYKRACKIFKELQKGKNRTPFDLCGDEIRFRAQARLGTKLDAVVPMYTLDQAIEELAPCNTKEKLDDTVVRLTRMYDSGKGVPKVFFKAKTATSGNQVVDIAPRDQSLQDNDIVFITYQIFRGFNSHDVEVVPVGITLLLAANTYIDQVSKRKTLPGASSGTLGGKPFELPVTLPCYMPRIRATVPSAAKVAGEKRKREDGNASTDQAAQKEAMKILAVPDL